MPKLVEPLNYIGNWVILDFKACLMHCQGMGKDPNALYGSADGREVNTAEHTVRAFIDAYLIPIFDNGFAPRQILVAHDDGHEYRSALLPSYKAKRDARKNDDTKTNPEQTQEVMKATRSLKALMAYLGCTQLGVKGVEGDDIIAYLCQSLSGTKQVYTVDADLLRLADESTMVYLKNNPIYISDLDLDGLPKNMEGFVAPFLQEDGEIIDGVNLFNYLTLYKSIVGDTADEYKGIPGQGDKAWYDIVKLFELDGLEQLRVIVALKDWEELKGILEAYAEQMPNSREHKLVSAMYEHRNTWRTCWTVADLHPELCWKPFKRQLTHLQWYKRVPNSNHVKQVLGDNDCLEFYEELERFMPVEWLIDSTNFEESDVEEFAQLVEKSPWVSFDYEGFTEYQDWVDALLENTSMTSYVDVIGQKITGCSFNFGDNLQYTFYLTFDHKDSNNLPIEVLKKFFDAIPADKIKVAHNSTFEEVLTYNNLDGYVMPIGSVFDTMIMSSYDNENRDSHGLKALSKELLNYDQMSYEDLLKKYGASNMQELTADQVLQYGLDDSTVTGHLMDMMTISLQLQGMWDFYRGKEPYVNHRLAMSHIAGSDLDLKRLAEIREEDEADIAEYTEKLRTLLEEHCSKPNVAGAKTFYNEEVKFWEASARKALHKLDAEKLIAKADSVAEEIEAMPLADEEMLEIANRIRAKVPFAQGKKAKAERDTSGIEPKALIAWILKYQMKVKYKECLEGAVYIPYKAHYKAPEFVPTVKNLDAVAEKVGLEPPNTAAKGKLSTWEAEVRDVDFETGNDNYESFTEDQKMFVDLLREAKEHFKPEDRGHEDFVKFSNFCAKVLGLEGKTTYSGTELNIGSPKQVSHLLYCMLGLPVRLRGKASAGRQSLGFFQGSPSTDALAQDTAMAEDVAGNPEKAWIGEVLSCIKKITESQTRISLYHNSYPYLVHPKTGKIHPSVRNCGTVTRRPSGNKPNVLQVSKHQKKGAMRGVYIPPKGYAVVPIDFAGQELRVQASETKDPNLLSVYLGTSLTKQYLKGEVLDITYNMVKDKTDLKDLHSMTAAGITQHFGLNEAGDLVPGGQLVKWAPPSYEDYIEAISNEGHEFNSLCAKVRKKPAKQTNFLLSYGGTHITLSHRLIVPEKVAEQIMSSTLTLYAGIVEAQEATVKYAREYGFVVTAYGNRRHANDDIFSKSNGPVSRQMRQLYNYRIQGCAADILKVVLSECEKRQIWDRYNSIMVAPVYDEVVAYVPFEHCWDFVQEMRSIMNLTPPGHAVPMVADVSIGHNWQVQHELGHQPTKEEFMACLEEKVVPLVNARWEVLEAA